MSLAQEMTALKEGKPVPIQERPQAGNLNLSPVACRLSPLIDHYTERVRELHNFCDYAFGKFVTELQRDKLMKEHLRLCALADAALQALWDSGISKSETLKIYKEAKENLGT